MANRNRENETRKQCTLFQTWGTKKLQKKVCSNEPAVGPLSSISSGFIDLCDDDDDALLTLAMEESLKQINTMDTGLEHFTAQNNPAKSSITRPKFSGTHGNDSNSTMTKNPALLFQQISDDVPSNKTGTSAARPLDSAHSNNDLNTLPRATVIEDLPGFDKNAGDTWVYPTNYPVRDYQFNIVETALYKNTLVTLPTGLGKTFIAAVMMYNFYRWYPRGKIVFMAPTKPLVAQQIEACYNIMGIPQVDTAEMTGAMAPPERVNAWRNKRVFFLTPQVMTNDLSRGAFPASDIKCLVVDEAHKATGNHAYCQVVRELVKYDRNFRVLALSATPGSDIKAVQQVIENLLISVIELRTEDSIDIQPYSHERKVEKIVVPLGEELAGVKAKYIELLSARVDRLKQMRVIYNREVTSLSKFLLLKSRESFRQNPPPNLQPHQYGIVEGEFALLISLYHGFELLQLHGSRSLYTYLNSLVNGEKGNGRTRSQLLQNAIFDSVMEILHKKFEPQMTLNGSFSSTQSKPFVISHPKLGRLQDIVVEHFTKFQEAHGTTDTRIMIFSQYRDSVSEIQDMLNRQKPLVRVMSFIGQSSVGKAAKKGLTQKEQLRVMKEFREGSFNTLVSTCVGEEGLDIGDVDLIICFDAHKSPIRLVQRMGRTGRKREGRIVMLVTEGKEESVYNQSVSSKKSIHKAILNGTKSLRYYDHNPRMIPLGLNPVALKMHITVDKKFVNTNHRKMTSTAAQKQISLPTGSKASECDGFLTNEEFEKWQGMYRVIESLPKLPGHNDFVSLSKYQEKTQITVDPRVMDLAKWMPWQNRLQTTFLVDNSIETKNMVELMEFMEIQSCNPDGEDHYGIEMSAYLNKADVLEPGQKDDNIREGIEKFCTTVEKDTEKSIDSKKKAVKKFKRRSARLPEFDAEEENSDSDADLPPAFDTIKVKNTKKEIINIQNNKEELNGYDSDTNDVKIIDNLEMLCEESECRVSVKKKSSSPMEENHSNLRINKKPKSRKAPAKPTNNGKKVTPVLKEKKKKKASVASLSRTSLIQLLSDADDEGEFIGEPDRCISPKVPVVKCSTSTTETAKMVNSPSNDIEYNEDPFNLSTLNSCPDPENLPAPSMSKNNHVPSPPCLSELDQIVGKLGEKEQLSPVDVLGLIDMWEAEKQHIGNERTVEINGTNQNGDDQVANFDVDFDFLDEDMYQPPKPVKKGDKPGAKVSVVRDTVKIDPFSDVHPMSGKNVLKPDFEVIEKPITEKTLRKVAAVSPDFAIVNNVSDDLFDDSDEDFQDALGKMDLNPENIENHLFKQYLEPEQVNRNNNNIILKKTCSPITITPIKVLAGNTPHGKSAQSPVHLELKHMGNVTPNSASHMNKICSTPLIADRKKFGSNCDSLFDDNDDLLLAAMQPPQLIMKEDGKFVKSHSTSQLTFTQALESLGEIPCNADKITTIGTAQKTNKDAARASKSSDVVLEAVRDNGGSPPLFDLGFEFDDFDEDNDIIPPSQDNLHLKPSMLTSSQIRTPPLYADNLKNADAVDTIETEKEIKEYQRYSPSIIKTPKSVARNFSGGDVSKNLFSLKLNRKRAHSINDSSLQKDAKKPNLEGFQTVDEANILDSKQTDVQKMQVSSCELFSDEDDDFLNGLGEKTWADLDGAVQQAGAFSGASQGFQLPQRRTILEPKKSPCSLESEDEIVMKKKKKAVIVESPEFTAEEQMATEFKTPLGPLTGMKDHSRVKKSLLEGSSDEDFECSEVKVPTITSKGSLKENQVTKNKPKKKKCHFLDEEAELSDEYNNCYSDEDESHLDCLEASFINDHSRMTQEDTSMDMQAVYMRSIMDSAANRMPGRFKLQYNQHHSMNVYSQAIQEEDLDDYEMDSFCVGSDYENSGDEDSPIAKAEKKNKSKKKKVIGLIQGKHRIKSIQGSSDSDQEDILNGVCATQATKNSPAVNKVKLKTKNRRILDDSDTSLVQSPKIDLKQSSHQVIRNIYSTQTRNILAEPISRNCAASKTGTPTFYECCQMKKNNQDNCQLSNVVQNDRPLFDLGLDFDPKADEVNHINDEPQFNLGLDDLDDLSDSEFQGIQIPEMNTFVTPSEPPTTENDGLVSFAAVKSSQRNISNIRHNSQDLSAKPVVDNRIQTQLGDSQTTSNIPSRNGDKQREERLKRQQQKQEEFRRKMSNKQQQTSSINNVSAISCLDSQVVNNGSSSRQTGNFSKISSPVLHSLTSSPKLSRKDKLVILVDSREINGAQDLVSALRLEHNLNPVVCQLTGCDFIVSNRMAVERKNFSDFMNGANKGKLLDRLGHMCELYDRPCLVLEKDRVKPGDEKIPEKPLIKSKYVESTLASLSRTHIKVLFSDSQVMTAELLADLCHIEQRKEMAISVPTSLTEGREQVFRFYLSIPQVSYVTALNFCQNFRSLQDFIKGPVELLQSRGCVSRSRAGNIYKYIRTLYKST